MSITVQELIEQLKDCNPDAEVRFASQPHWPFENEIDADVVEPQERPMVLRVEFDEMSEDDQQEVMEKADRDEVMLIENDQELPPPVVYLGEGRQVGYLPENIKRQFGW